MCEPSAGAPTQNSPNPDLCTGQIPPDPLLEPGTFIDADPATTTEGENHPKSTGNDSPKSRQEERTRPLSDFATENAGQTPSSRKKKKVMEETGEAIPSAVTERPDWLPKDWRMDVRVRTSGATAGLFDRYYVEPTNGRRFRSKNEVLYFLETGEKMKKRPTPDGAPDAMASPGSKEKKEKKERKSSTKSKTKKPPPINYDFNQPPETVSWKLSDVAADKWDPSVGGEKVAESIKNEWAAVFDRICEIQSKSSGS